MFSFRDKIAKAGKEVKGIFEAICTEDVAHVMDKEPKVVCLELFRKCDTVGSQVKSCYVVALSGQDAGMSSSSAGNIHYMGIHGRVQIRQQPGNKLCCFGFVPFEIQFMIVG